MSIFLLLIEIFIAPLSFGFLCPIWNSVHRTNEKTLLEYILEVYTNGMLLLFLIFDLICLMHSQTPSFYEMLDCVRPIWGTVLICGSIVGFTVFIIFVAIKYKSIRFKTITKKDIARIVFILFYIGTAVLFVLPGSYDDTIIHITYAAQYGGVPARNELLYVVCATLLNMPSTPFIHYAISGSFLLFFFGIYLYLFQTILPYLPNLETDTHLIEMLFSIILIALFFIRGSLYTSIPQNIWNGKTMLASCILPLAFAFGFAFYNGKKIIWILRMILLIPICRLFHENGGLFIIVLLVVTIIATALNHVRLKYTESRGN